MTTAPAPPTSPESHSSDARAETRARAGEAREEIRDILDRATYDESTNRFNFASTDDASEFDAQQASLESLYAASAFSEPLQFGEFVGICYDQPDASLGKLYKEVDNQDRGYTTANEIVAVDGAGGEGGGNIVAEITAKVLKEEGEQTTLDDKEDDEVLQITREIVAKADQAIWDRKKLDDNDPDKLRAGATGTLAYFRKFKDKDGKMKAVYAIKGDAIIVGRKKQDKEVVRLGVEESLAAVKARAGHGYDTAQAHLIVNGMGQKFDRHGSQIEAYNDKPGEFHLDDANIGIIDLDEFDRFLITTDGVEKAIVDEHNNGELRESFVKVFKKRGTPKKTMSRIVKLAGNLKSDDQLGFVIENKESLVRDRTLALGKKAVRMVNGEAIDEKREHRRTELETRRDQLDAAVASFFNYHIGRGASGLEGAPERVMAARQAALEQSRAMQDASRKEQKKMQPDLEAAITLYAQLLEQEGNLSNWSPENIRKLRALDAQDVKLRLLAAEEKGILKGNMLEFMGRHKIITAVGGVAVGAVITLGGGLIIAGAGLGTGVALAGVAGTGVAFRGVRSYGTSISRRYAPTLTDKVEENYVPGSRFGNFLKRERSDNQFSNYLPAAVLGAFAAFAGAVGTAGNVLNHKQETLLEHGTFGALLVGGLLLVGRRGMQLRAEGQKETIANMGDAEKAQFIAGNMQEMVKEDLRIRNRALVYTALAVVVGAGMAEYLNHSFSGGNHASVEAPHADRPQVTKPSASANPTSYPTSYPETSPGPSASATTPTTVPSSAAPIPSASVPPAEVPPITIPAEAPDMGISDHAMNMDKALDAVADNRAATTVTSGEGVYNQIDNLIKATPAFKDTNLSADQYREVMMRAGPELQNLKFANGESVVYAVKNAAGSVQAYGFSSATNVPTAANEVLLRHIAEVQGLAVTHDPSAASHLLDNVDFSNAAEQTQVSNSSQLENLYPKMAELRGLGVTNNDYAAITQRLEAQGFDFPANGHLSHDQLEQVVQAAAEQKGVNLQVLHDLVVVNGGSIDTLFNNIPKEALTIKGGGLFAEALQQIPQLQPLGIDFTNPATITEIASRVNGVRPGFLTHTSGNWTFASDGRLTPESFRQILEAARPGIRSAYGLAS